MSLREMIDDAYEMARRIAEAGVSDAKNRNLPQLLRMDLVRFCIYLAFADRELTQSEAAFIRDTFDYPVSWENRNALVKAVGADTGYGSEVPGSFKYFVLADAGQRVKNDPDRHRKTRKLLSLYGELGRSLLAVKDDTGPEGTVALSAYTAMLEEFMGRYGLGINKNLSVTPPKKSGTQTAEKGAETPDKTAELTEEKIEQALAELNALIGLETVKTEVRHLVNLMRVQKMRRDNGLKTGQTSRHMAFYGNPGTGKTTVARLLAGIYGELGLLPTGQLVEVDRSGLVGGYVGQTALKTREVIDEAMGGILFIDEAYTLTARKGENDFGQEAVDTILKAMEDYREQMVVIAAGYTELMQEFLESNPGLRSRFGYTIEFPDYTPEELLAILELQCKKNEYQLSAAAREKAAAYFKQRCANKPANFANARDVRNYLEKAMLNHAGRVVKLPPEERTREALSLIEAEDLKGIRL